MSLIPGHVATQRSHQPPRRRWRRRFVIAIVAIGAGIAVSVASIAQHGRSVLRAAIAEADANDPYWRLAQIEEHRELIPDEENAALQLNAARRLIDFAALRTPPVEQ